MSVLDYGKILTDPEIEEIRDYLKQNRHVWTHASEIYPPKDWPQLENAPGHSIGGPYQNCRDLTDPKVSSKVQREQDFLNTPIIVNLRNKALKLFTDKYNLPAEHLPKTSVPGFNIFNSQNRNKVQIIKHWHTDAIDNYFPDKKVDILYSVIVAIEVPRKSSNGIDYIEDGIEKFFRYESGHVYVWSSDVMHKIPNLYLEDDEYRITYQMFFIIEDGKIWYYW
jgi:hypothetical protein